MAASSACDAMASIRERVPTGDLQARQRGEHLGWAPPRQGEDSGHLGRGHLIERRAAERAPDRVQRVARNRRGLQFREHLAHRSFAEPLRIRPRAIGVGHREQRLRGRTEPDERVDHPPHVVGVERDQPARGQDRLLRARHWHLFDVEAVTRDLGPHVGLRWMNPGATELERMTFVRRGMGSAPQAIAGFDQYRASTAHRQLARGRHAGETAADDHHVARRLRGADRRHARRDDGGRATLQNRAACAHLLNPIMLTASAVRGIVW